MIIQKNRKVPDQLKINNNIIHGDSNIANALNNHFINIGTKLSDSTPTSNETAEHYRNKQQKTPNSIFILPTNDTEI